MSDVIRYGAGGKPYIGAVGDRSTEAIIVATEEKEPEVKIDFKVEEDDTPLTEEQVVIKAKGKKR
jgi:hypothetical protein